MGEPRKLEKTADQAWWHTSAEHVGRVDSNVGMDKTEENHMLGMLRTVEP